jgi:uncharacterized YccA/Bax inhibitor family protein
MANRFTSSSNPFVNEKQLSKATLGVSKSAEGTMTVQGAVNKSIILTAILIVSAVIAPQFLTFSMPLFYGTLFGGLALAMISLFKPAISPITGPLYAVVEGIFIGMISNMFAEMIDPSIVLNAVLLTALCLASMLIAYKTGLIKATEKFRSMVTTATGAIMMIYMLSWVLGMFGVNIPYLHEGGMMGIGISLFIIGIACLNLILDFDSIEKFAAAGAPKHMEWYCGVSLLVTLVWIYIEILRLLAVMSSSD